MLTWNHTHRQKRICTSPACLGRDSSTLVGRIQIWRWGTSAKAPLFKGALHRNNCLARVVTFPVREVEIGELMLSNPNLYASWIEEHFPPAAPRVLRWELHDWKEQGQRVRNRKMSRAHSPSCCLRTSARRPSESSGSTATWRSSHGVHAPSPENPEC